jgi:hypothetical protein
VEPHIQVATDTPDGIRAVNKAKPVDPGGVEQYLEGKFGDALPAVRDAMRALAKRFKIFGFTGSHRFYYGKPITGTIWFFTAGLLLIGWLIDLFLIPWMDRKADRLATSWAMARSANRIEDGPCLLARR